MKMAHGSDHCSNLTPVKGNGVGNKGDLSSKAEAEPKDAALETLS